MQLVRAVSSRAERREVRMFFMILFLSKAFRVFESAIYEKYVFIAFLIAIFLL